MSFGSQLYYHTTHVCVIFFWCFCFSYRQGWHDSTFLIPNIYTNNVNLIQIRYTNYKTEKIFQELSRCISHKSHHIKKVKSKAFILMSRKYIAHCILYCLSFCLSVFCPVCMSVCLSVCTVGLTVLSVFLSVIVYCLSFCLCLCPVYLPVCLPFCESNLVYNNFLKSICLSFLYCAWSTLLTLFLESCGWESFTLWPKKSPYRGERFVMLEIIGTLGAQLYSKAKTAVSDYHMAREVLVYLDRTACRENQI